MMLWVLVYLVSEIKLWVRRCQNPKASESHVDEFENPVAVHVDRAACPYSDDDLRESTESEPTSFEEEGAEDVGAKTEEASSKPRRRRGVSAVLAFGIAATSTAAGVEHI